MATNKIETIKAARHPLDVLEDIYRYAKLGWEAVPEDDWERMKWYGVFYRRTTPGFFMMRLRMPNGILSSVQLRAIGEIVTLFGRDQADLTTRENIQIRWITIEKVPEIFERLKAVGLTSQQSGMDNMRNVVGCPIAGLDASEAFDASPLAAALQDGFVGVRELSNLPRKFNISITGCLDDCAHAQGHDLSYVPAEAETPTGRRMGFNVLVGGALGGKDPRLATPLDVFVLPEEVLSLNRAVLEVFRDNGPRDARNKARLKVLLEQWGTPRFRAELERQLGRPLLPAGSDLTRRYGGDHIGVHHQRQPNSFYVGMLVPVGRVTGGQLTELARLSEVYGQSEVRLSPDQNVILPFVRRDNLPDLLREPLLRSFSPFPSPLLRGLVCCTGNDYCHFSLIDTKGEALKLVEALEGRLSLDRPVSIRMSGCPNACGQHHIGDISLLAVKVKRGDRVVDAADVSIGGRLGPQAQLATPAADGVPLDELPDFLKKFLQTPEPDSARIGQPISQV